MLAYLDQHPRQYVKAVGKQFGLTEDVASKNLQMLAAAGFLESERKGRYLYYRLTSKHELVREVLVALRKAKMDIDPVVHTLTALTHERRIAIIAALSEEPLEFDMLCRRTGISGMAAARHVDKLVRRGWVKTTKDQCRLRIPDRGLGRVLIKSVAHSITLAQV